MTRSKRFGQHFLNDTSIAASIVDFACLNRSERVLEIGPGYGILTKELAKKSEHVVALELDKRLVHTLKRELKNLTNVDIIQGDALSFDFSSFISPFMIVSNLPYNISVPLTIRLIESNALISDMVMMYQQEVAERLYAEPGQKAYGVLSIAVQYHAEVFQLMKVGRSLFTPVPAVDSEVVRITPRKQPAVSVKDERVFFQTVRTLFTHRRKTIKNNLKSRGIPEKKIFEALSCCRINPDHRGETLNMEEFAALADHFVLGTRK